MNESLRFCKIEFITEMISHSLSPCIRNIHLHIRCRYQMHLLLRTAIQNNWSLYTDDKKDFDFIKEIDFYTEK